MKIRQLALAALAAVSFNAQAALVEYAPWNATYPGISGVLFNVNSANGVTVAMGAHAYKNSVSLPNDGVGTYYAAAGLYAPDTAVRANWSFDFAWDLGANCTGCTVQLLVDKNPGNAVEWSTLPVGIFLPGAVRAESWNMEMGFMDLFTGGFDPYGASQTAFSLQVLDAQGGLVTSSDISVNVPEPGSLALLGLGLAGMGAIARRRTRKQ